MFQDYVPKFVKHFANAGEMMVQAFKDYDQEVKAGTYPTEAHGFKIEEEIIEKLKEIEDEDRNDHKRSEKTGG